MVQLKQVSIRLKSIKNIQKITKTMKMVSASKFTKAERDLKQARPFGYAPRKFYESAHLIQRVKKDDKEKELVLPEKVEEKKTSNEPYHVIYIAMTSDRGLCGGVHSGVARAIRREISELKVVDSPNHRLVCVGDKGRSMLRRQFSKNMLVSAKEIGRIAPNFMDASRLSQAISASNYSYDKGNIYYNKYYSPVKYVMTKVPIFTQHIVEIAPNIMAFDDIEDDLQSYVEWTLAALLYYVLKECAASEQSARMAAMDNATKNASEMIRKLTLLFNRTRQAVITRELIEIISGAAALK